MLSPKSAKKPLTFPKQGIVRGFLNTDQSGIYSRTRRVAPRLSHMARQAAISSGVLSLFTMVITTWGTI